MSIYEKRVQFAFNELARRLELKKFRFEYRDDETFETYFGMMIPITLMAETRHGEVHRQLFVKMPKNKKNPRHAGVFQHLYEVESFFYNTLLPRYKSLSRIDLSDFFAECYYTDTTSFEEVIILKDVREDGFRRYQGNRFLDFEHIVMSLHALALLHSLSMILQNEQDNIDTNHFLKSYSLNFPQEYMTYLKTSINNNADLFKDTKHAVFFDKLAANFDAVVNNCVRNAKHLVYGHGDFWKENIMFKYEDNKPKNACVLDFQTIRLLCPAQDVLSFLLTSAKTEMRRQYYDFFLETYYSRLQDILLEHSLNPNIIYSKVDFFSDLKTVSSYCFLTTDMSFSLWLGLEKESLLESNHKCGEKNMDSGAIAFYKQTMLEIADDFIAFGFYNTSH